MSQGQQAGAALQELSQQLEELEAVKEQLADQLGATQTEKQEVKTAIETLGDLETGSTVQVPLGGDAYVRAEIQDIEDVIVSLGADYAAERSQAGAIETLENRIDQLDEQIAEIQDNLSDVDTDIQEVESHAQQVRQQMAQQQAQQMGGMGLGGEDS